MLNIYFCFIKFHEKGLVTPFQDNSSETINLIDCLFCCSYRRVVEASAYILFLQSLLFCRLLRTCNVKSFSSVNISFLTFQMVNWVRSYCGLSNCRWIALAVFCGVIIFLIESYPHFFKLSMYKTFWTTHFLSNFSNLVLCSRSLFLR